MMPQDREPPVEVGEKYEVEVTERGGQGDPMAKINGFVVFINQKVEMGNQIIIKITKIKRTFAIADIISPSVSNVAHPFFAYGLFREDELSYHRIADYVHPVESTETREIQGELLVEDGLILLNLNTDEDRLRTVQGDLIYFDEEIAKMAYATIESAEPMTHYSWKEIEIGDERANVLVMNSDYKIEETENKRLVEPDPTDLISRNYFEEIMSVVAEDVPTRDGETDRRFFCHQRGYLLLWSAIERYISLKWGKTSDDYSKQKRERFAAYDNQFQQAVRRNLHNQPADPYRTLYRSDTPTSKFKLKSHNTEKVINYLYQIRSNVTHRGKGNPTADEALLSQAFTDLYQIFYDVLNQQYESILIPEL